ncbi:MAG: KR domain-containing protein, partial [Myxococcales bacterium]|nr:KR domain-containing protein [Myxococcales bacterium]
RGVEVEVAAVDVGDAPALAAVIAAIPTAAPLRAVFHCAGISEPRPLLETSLAQVVANDRAKVVGSWNLHRLTADLDLDLFVGFSSMASVWGAALLGPYDGANHFIDVLSHHRRARGLPAQAINWGGWAGPGMTTVEVQRYAARMGLGVAPAPVFLAALDRLLADPRPVLALGPVDWRVFKPVLESYGPRPLLAAIAEGEAAANAGEGPLSSALSQAGADARWALLIAALGEAVATLLGHGHADAIDEGAGFFELGMDSVTSVALRNELERAVGLSLPPTLAFEHPSVRALAEFLAKALAEAIGLEIARPTDRADAPATDSAADSAPPLTTAPATADDPSLVALSEDELEALLAAELSGD